MATPEPVNKLLDALRSISKWSEDDNKRCTVDPNHGLMLWRGCVATAKLALEEYEKVHAKSTEIIYAIGVQHGPAEYGMTAGPTPKLNEMISHVGGPGYFIIGFKESSDGSPDPISVPLYEWLDDKWVSLSDHNWRLRLHREECPSVNIGGSPTKCTCDRRGGYILGRRGPRQPGEYDT